MAMGHDRFKKKAAPYLYLSPTLMVMLILLVVPIGLVIYYSFLNNAIVVKEPSFVAMDNYNKLLGDKNFWASIRNTAFFVVFSVVGHLTLGLGFSMLLNSEVFSRKTKGFFRIMYVLPWMFTASVIAILWKLMLQPQGIIDYLLSALHIVSKNAEWLSARSIALQVITFINIWCGYPFFVISILAALQGVSKDLYESAAIDGASTWKRFTKITVPQIKPILVSGGMLDIVWCVQSFAVIWMLTGGGPVLSTETLSVFIYKLAFNSSKYALASAAAVIALLICIGLVVVYIREQKKIGSA
jgi:multiple sugar transport system permease protein